MCSADRTVSCLNTSEIKVECVDLTEYLDQETLSGEHQEFKFLDIQPQKYEATFTNFTPNEANLAENKPKLSFVRLIPQDREKLAKLFESSKVGRPLKIPNEKILEIKQSRTITQNQQEKESKTETENTENCLITVELGQPEGNSKLTNLRDTGVEIATKKLPSTISQNSQMMPLIKDDSTTEVAVLPAKKHKKTYILKPVMTEPPKQEAKTDSQTLNELDQYGKKLNLRCTRARTTDKTASTITKSYILRPMKIDCKRKMESLLPKQSPRKRKLPTPATRSPKKTCSKTLPTLSKSKLCDQAKKPAVASQVRRPVKTLTKPLLDRKHNKTPAQEPKTRERRRKLPTRSPEKPIKLSTISSEKSTRILRSKLPRKETNTAKKVHDSVLFSVWEGQLVKLLKISVRKKQSITFTRTVYDMAHTLAEKYKIDTKLLTEDWYQSFLKSHPEIDKIAASHPKPTTTANLKLDELGQLTYEHDAEIVQRTINISVQAFSEDFYATVIRIANKVADQYKVARPTDGQQKCYSLMADFPILIVKRQVVDKFRRLKRM